MPPFWYVGTVLSAGMDMIRPQIMDRGMRILGGGILICLVLIAGNIVQSGKIVACAVGSYGLLTGLFNFCPLCYFILQEKKEKRKHESFESEISHNSVKPLCFFEGFSDQEIKKIIKCCRLRRVPAHEIMIAEGSEHKALYIIYSGQFKFEKKVSDDETKLIGTITDGDTFGEFSFFRRMPSSVTVVSLEESKVLIIDEIGFASLFDDPALAVKVMSRLMESAGKRMAALHEQIASLGNWLLQKKRENPAA